MTEVITRVCNKREARATAAGREGCSTGRGPRQEVLEPQLGHSTCSDRKDDLSFGLRPYPFQH
jgi:hypothetical protein